MSFEPGRHSLYCCFWASQGLALLLRKCRHLQRAAQQREQALLQMQGTCCLMGRPWKMLRAQCSLTAVQEWDVKRLCFEADTEPYAKERDAKILQLAEAAGVEVHTPISHTLFVSLGLRLCS